MQNQPFSFFFEDTDDLSLPTEAVSNWLNQVVAEESYTIEYVNLIFCSDAYLLSINQQFLKHDYFTDIITFQYSDEPIEAELFISVDRVNENAQGLQVPFMTELNRVMVHGLLHCCGYGDKLEEEKVLMKEKENYYLEKVQANG